MPTNQPIPLADKTPCIGASIGIALYPDDDPDLEHCIQRADDAMTWASNNAHTCFYELRPDHQTHPHHAREFAQRGIRWHLDRELVPRIQALTAQAQAQLKDGAPAEAAATARQALALHPYHQPALSLLAQAEWQLGKREDALSDQEQVMRADKQKPDNRGPQKLG